MSSDDEQVSDDYVEKAGQAMLEAVTLVLLEIVAENKHPLVAALWEPLYDLLIFALEGQTEIGFCQLFVSDALNEETQFAVTAVPVGATSEDVAIALEEFIATLEPWMGEEKIVAMKGGWAKCASCDTPHPVVREVETDDDNEYVITYTDDEADEYEDTGVVTDYHPPSMN